LKRGFCNVRWKKHPPPIQRLLLFYKKSVMKITPEILAALEAAVNTHGGAAALAQRSAVNPANLSRYLNGKVHSITDDNWAKLLPWLPHMQNAPQSSFGVRCETIRNTAEVREFIKDAMLKRGLRDASDLCRAIGYDNISTIERLLRGELDWFPQILSALFDSLELDRNAAPIPAEERSLLAPRGIYRDGALMVRPLPVVDWANAAGHLEMIVNDPDAATMHNWDTENCRTVPLPVGSRCDTQAFKVSGVSMDPALYDGDIIFVEPVFSVDEIPDRRIVVAKIAEGAAGDCGGTVVCKRFRRDGEGFLLTSDNPQGRIIHVSRGDFSWIGIAVRKISDL
jgi:SOS-response transcriptional repressor LexA